VEGGGEGGQGEGEEGGHQVHQVRHPQQQQQPAHGADRTRAFSRCVFCVSPVKCFVTFLFGIKSEGDKVEGDAHAANQCHQHSLDHELEE